MTHIPNKKMRKVKAWINVDKETGKTDNHPGTGLLPIFEANDAQIFLDENEILIPCTITYEI